MKFKSEKNSGITLIALVVTIIILLILTGVSISMLTGQNGILNRVAEAKEKTSLGQKQEKQDMSNLEELINDSTDGSNVEKVKDLKPGELEKESDDVFIINSIEDLVFFSYDVRNGNNYNGKTVKLGCSLDFNSNKSYVDAFRTDYGKYGYDGELKENLTSNVGWISIGDVININQNNFKGTFDGGNETIYNLCINKSNITETLYIGLFANNQGMVKNLNLKNTKIYTVANDEIYYFVAGIAGNNEGTIINCTVEGKHQSKGNYALISGIAGRNQGNIENCINMSNISGEAMFMSGIVAQNLCKVSQCGNEGIVNSEKNGTYIGGIAGLGFSENACIESSYNKGNIFFIANVSSHIGGITGQAQCQVKNCYNSGKISITANDSTVKCNIGGIAGIEVDELKNCYNKGTIEAKNFGEKVSIGGIIGKYNLFAVSNVYSETEITLIKSDSANKGLLIGLVDDNANIVKMKNLYFYGKEDAFGKNLSGRDISYVNLEKKAEPQKILEIVNSDDENKFIEDTNNINDGYPILNWQKN